MTSEMLDEFLGVQLGDERLNKRVAAVVTALGGQPHASYPQIFGKNSSDLEAFYRLIEHPHVQDDVLLEPHREATVVRCQGRRDVVVAHDTTAFDNAGARALLKDTERGEAGFMGHFSFAMDPENREPLGVLRMHTWLRSGDTQTALRKRGAKPADQRAIPSEMDRWYEGVSDTAALFDDPQQLIHVCDSEADAFTLLAPLVDGGHRFIVRGCYDRRTKGTGKLREILQSQPVVTQREVFLSKRGKTKGTSSKTRHLPRQSRSATLQIRSGQITIMRPASVLAALNQPKELALNVVYVLESEPPEGCAAVEWILLTTDPINTPEEVEKVVDLYRCRWKIEEYFKALKTGCSYEARQMESLRTLKNALALFVPVAWQMLHLRYQTESGEVIPAESSLGVEPLKILRYKAKEPIHTATDVMYAIASLGGHIKNNGRPGWIVLWRGLQKLNNLVEGVILARKICAEM